jgi:hypothetical protein
MQSAAISRQFAEEACRWTAFGRQPGHLYRILDRRGRTGGGEADQERLVWRPLRLAVRAREPTRVVALAGKRAVGAEAVLARVHAVGQQLVAEVGGEAVRLAGRPLDRADGLQAPARRTAPRGVRLADLQTYRLTDLQTFRLLDLQTCLRLTDSQTCLYASGANGTQVQKARLRERVLQASNTLMHAD